MARLASQLAVRYCLADRYLPALLDNPLLERSQSLRFDLHIPQVVAALAARDRLKPIDQLGHHRAR
jgi:hypothetical protein